MQKSISIFICDAVANKNYGCNEGGEAPLLHPRFRLGSLRDYCKDFYRKHTYDSSNENIKRNNEQQRFVSHLAKRERPLVEQGVRGILRPKGAKSPD